MPLGNLLQHLASPSLTDHVRPLRLALGFVCALACAPGIATADGSPLAPSVTESQSRPVVSSDGRGAAIVSYKTSTGRVGAVHVGLDGLADGRFAFAPITLPFELEESQPLRALGAGDSALLVLADLAGAGRPVSLRVGDLGVPEVGQPVSLGIPLRRPVFVPGANGRTILIAMDADATSFWTLRIATLDRMGALESATELSSVRQFFYGDAIAACSDGAGGLLAAMPYYDAAVTGSKDIGIFRYAADGSRPWGDVCRPLVIAARDQVDVQVVPDGQGGMLMTWTDPRVVSRSTDIYAHRVDAAGQRNEDWGYYGNPICDANGAQSQPRMISDGTGGAWIVWYDQRASLDGDLRYTHMLGDGTLAPGFTSAGAVLVELPGIQREAALSGDGAGGMFVVWRDDRSGDADVYAQHVLANGTVAPGWAANGRLIAQAPGAQDQPAITTVSAGRAIMAWRDARDGVPTRIYTTTLIDASVTGVPPSRDGALALAPARAANGKASVRVTLPALSEGRLELIDATGRRIESRRLDGPLESQEIRFDAALSPGLYFVRLQSAGKSAYTRITVLR